MKSKMAYNFCFFIAEFHKVGKFIKEKCVHSFKFGCTVVYYITYNPLKYKI
jgi:hypothetical protein